MSPAHQEAMLSRIRAAQADYAELFSGGWQENQLSELGWMILVGVPWLLSQTAPNGDEQGKGGDSNSNPGADGIGPAQSPVEFVLPEQPLAATPCVVPASQPLAKFIKAHFAQAVSELIVFLGRLHDRISDGVTQPVNGGGVHP